MTIRKHTSKTHRKCRGRCGMVRGLNAFPRWSKVCRACLEPAPVVVPVAELVDEKLEAHIRSVREAAGVPVGGSR